MLVQPHQFRIAREVGDLDEVGCIVPARENPAKMAIKKASMTWRVNVPLGVRVQMMMTMFGRPPQNAFLGRALRHEGEHELERSAGRICTMREVTVVAGAN